MQQGYRNNQDGSAQPADTPPAASLRYLRFVRALVLGSALAAAPVVMSGCGNSQCASGSCRPDAAHPDAAVYNIDGPLPPPDLPLALA